MKLTAGLPYGPSRNGPINAEPPLARSRAAEVVVIGAGITGALLTETLANRGFDCVTLDQREPGQGSTGASTSLLQYETDASLYELSETLGAERAVTVYRTARATLDVAERLCRRFEGIGFSRRSSVCFASSEQYVDDLRAEFDLRLKSGFSVDWLDAAAVRTLFDWPAPAGLISEGAEVDVYQLTDRLLRAAANQGARIFSGTRVEAIERVGKQLHVTTAGGHTVQAPRVVLAGGYECPKLLRRTPPIQYWTTFAFATAPLKRFDGWHDRCLIWETARPYLYARTTSDGRAMLGGEDRPFLGAESREDQWPEAMKCLANAWRKRFPRIPLEIDLAWAGTFATTLDSLPYIGPAVEEPDLFAALCYGGNGIVFSLMACDILTDWLAGRSHPCLEMFGLHRHN